MTLTEDIMANTATTKAYAKNAQVVVVKEGTAYTSTADLAGKTLLDEDSLLEALQYRAQEKLDG